MWTTRKILEAIGQLDDPTTSAKVDMRPDCLSKYLDFIERARSPRDGDPSHRHHIASKGLLDDAATLARGMERPDLACVFDAFKENPLNYKDLSPADHLRAQYFLFRAFPTCDSAIVPPLDMAVNALDAGSNEGLARRVEAEHGKVRAVPCGWQVRANFDVEPGNPGLVSLLNKAVEVLVVGDCGKGLVDQIAEHYGRVWHPGWKRKWSVVKCLPAVAPGEYEAALRNAGIEPMDMSKQRGFRP